MIAAILELGKGYEDGLRSEGIHPLQRLSPANICH